MTRFTESFGCYVCDGDSIETVHDGFTIVATVYRDNDGDAPWERDDCRGPVSEWVTRDKLPGERVLISDGSHHRYYDFQEACRIARKDGWGCEGGPRTNESVKAYAARAVERDFDVLQAWCNDEWHYCGVAVTVSKADTRLTGKYDHALWGIEMNYPDSDNSYLVEVANGLIDEALDAAKSRLNELCSEFCS